MCLKEKVREYGIAYGMHVYSDNELVALMTGVSEDKAEQVDMDNPLACSSVKGIGEKKAMAIAAINEYARRKYERVNRNVKIVHGPEDAYYFLKGKLEKEQKEHFGVILLNTKNHILGYKDVSIGSLNASIVHPREVFIEAILAHAASIILTHNHPSGDPRPSREDLAVTDRLYKSGNILDIPVLDHIIIGTGQYISLKEKGMIPLK